MLAMEEPELHVPPGLQRRLIKQAVSIAGQTICTSHTPLIAAFFPATNVQIFENRAGRLASTPLLDNSLSGDATAWERKFYYDDRGRVIEALMHSNVLVPEGRSEYEWFRLLADVVETGDRALVVNRNETPPFGAVVGVVPTRDATIIETFKRLRKLRFGVCVLVDGDRPGHNYVSSLLELDTPPDVIIQWPDEWKIENLICWILEGGDDDIINELKQRLDNHNFDTLNELKTLFEINEGAGRLKTDYLAYEEIAAVIRDYEECLARAEVLLDTITLACLGRYEESEKLERNEEQSTEDCTVLRFLP